MSPRTLAFVTSLCPFDLRGVSDEQLGDILDAWLADQFASDDHVHIHGIVDGQEVSR
ncbi:MAG: hypothetical protein AB7F78_01445 [Hyphomicrobiaceae bacterium]